MCLKRVLKNYPIDHNTITLSSICIQTLSYLKKTRQTQIYPINPKINKKNRNTHKQYLQLPKKVFFFFFNFFYKLYPHNNITHNKKRTKIKHIHKTAMLNGFMLIQMFVFLQRTQGTHIQTAH